MNTVDHTAQIRETIRKIEALGAQVMSDAENCAVAFDVAGLAYIANMAHGRPGNAVMRFGDVADLADYLRGEGVRLTRGRKP